MIASRSYSVRTRASESRRSPFRPGRSLDRLNCPRMGRALESGGSPCHQLAPVRPCRPLTIHALSTAGERRPVASGYGLAFASVVAVPRVIHMGGTLRTGSRNVRDSDLPAAAPISQSAPQMAHWPQRPRQAEADVVPPAGLWPRSTPRSAGVLETPGAEPPKPQVARAPVGSRRHSTKRRPDSAVKQRFGGLSASAAGAPAHDRLWADDPSEVESRALGSGTRMSSDPKTIVREGYDRASYVPIEAMSSRGRARVRLLVVAAHAHPRGRQSRSGPRCGCGIPASRRARP